MAFITALNTQHPKLWSLFKRVAWIFLAPLIVLAAIPILITTIAQLIAFGQVVFAFWGGVLASLPIVIRRKRRTRKEEPLGGVAACTQMGILITVSGCLLAWGLENQLAIINNPVPYMVISPLGGFGLFWGSFEIASKVERIFRGRRKHFRAGARSEDQKKFP
jgi:hypothetical protein